MPKSEKHVERQRADRKKGDDQTMSKVTIGVLLSMAALILLHNNQPFIGFPAFLLGIYLMLYTKK